MESTTPVIDMWAPIVRSREIMEHVAENFPELQLPYLSVFQKRDVTLAEFRDTAQAQVSSDADILASLDEAHIRLALITGFDEASTEKSTFVSNESVAAHAERHPERFLPFAGADIARGSEAIRELEHWVTKRGFKGLSLRPFMIGMPTTTRARR